MRETLEKSLLKKIERLEAFEERLNLRFEKISIKVDKRDWLTLFCELHPINGTSIEDKITINCVVYGEDDSILCVEEKHLYPEDFFAFEVIQFLLNADDIPNRTSKIRIYPRKY